MLCRGKASNRVYIVRRGIDRTVFGETVPAALEHLLKVGAGIEDFVEAQEGDDLVIALQVFDGVAGVHLDNIGKAAARHKGGRELFVHRIAR
jgi:hypothetical protein